MKKTAQKMWLFKKLLNEWLASGVEQLIVSVTCAGLIGLYTV